MVIKIVMIIIKLHEFIKNYNNSICIGNKTRNVKQSFSVFSMIML